MRTNATLLAVALALTSPAFATLDLNYDHVSDLWARAYPTAGAPTADPDGDGATNLAESLAGTNPFDPSSHFTAVPWRTAAGALELHWPSVTAKKYYLESSTDLTEWKFVPSDFAGTGTELSGTVLAAGTAASASQFWRVLVLDFDTDEDFLTDWEEIRLGTSPTLADSDRDELPDAWEITHGFNPLVNDAGADPDGDGYSNKAEYDVGTDPTYHALPVAGGPVIFWVSQPIRPDETMLITAGGIDRDAKVELAALPNGDPGSPLTTASLPSDWKTLTALTATPRSVTATVPADWSSGIYALRLTNDSLTGPVRLVNAPDPWFVQGDQGDTAQPGGSFTVAGTCLEQLGGVGPRAALVNGDNVVTTLALQDRLTTSTGYGLRFAVPADMPEGDYALYLHNGCGGPAGWVQFKTFITAPLETVTIRKPVAWPTIVFDVSQQLGNNHDERFAAAIAKAGANHGGRIYVPAGTYQLTRPLELPPYTVLAGAGREATIIEWPTVPRDPATGSSVAALVSGKILVVSPEERASFAIEDLTLQASEAFRRNVVERINTSKLGWIRRAAVRCVSNVGKLGWNPGPTAIRLEGACNTQLDSLALEGYFCVQMGTRTTYLRLVDSTLIWFDKTVGVDGRCHNLLVANNQFKQRDNPTSSDVGLNFTTNYGDAMLGGPFTRDLLWTGNFSAYDPAAPNPKGGYSSDCPEGIYLGKVASVRGTELNLAGATRVAVDDTGTPIGQAYNWAGGIVQILGGRGAGQWRFLAVAGPGQSTVTVDRPWDVEPDATSTVILATLQGRLMMIDNICGQEPESQDFYLTLDVLKVGNTLGADGADGWMSSWAGTHYGSTSAAWHTQVLDNKVVRGNKFNYTFMAANLEPTDYLGVVGAAQVYRNNTRAGTFSGDVRLSLDSRDNPIADLLIERNHLEIVSLQEDLSRRIALSGVLFRANINATGAPTPIGPAGTTPGVTVAE